jgi:hypothetical protein
MTALCAQQLLMYLAEPERCADLSLPQWQQLIWLLREAKLLAALAASLERRALCRQLPGYAKRHLHSALTYADRQSQQIRFECNELKRLLDDAGIPALYLKGSAYVLAGTANGRGRICNDLDVLVAKSQLADAEALLQKNGWRPDKLSDYDERYYRQWSHEIPPMVQIHRGTVLDLHHNLYLPISGRAADMARFFRLTQATVSGAMVLNPAAMVLHSIIHLFTNDDMQSGMRDLWDLYLLITQFSTTEFWHQLHGLAQVSGFCNELQYCLSALHYYLAPALDPLTLQQSVNGSSNGLWTRYIMLPALLPSHPLVCRWRHRRARQLVYLRGHWIKMPPWVLLKHLTIKTFFTARDQLFGKYQFAPKRPPNQHW